MWHCQKDTLTDQWKTVESPEINSYFHGQLVFDKDAKTIQWERTVFKKNVLGKLDFHIQEDKIKFLFHPTCKKLTQNRSKI